ncbi:MAG TPA: hypothetical protein VGG70_06025 [Candidatus Cybelea sp.]
MFRTLQAKASLAALVLASFALSLPARAVQLVPSQTFKSGTKIACTLDELMDSSKLSYGDTFKLRVVDTTHAALNGSEIIGYITAVRKPSGTEQGHVGFFLTTIKLPNGTKKPITAYVVNRRVTQYNPAAQYAQRQQLSPAAGRPYGSVTPGPIAWQMNMGSGPSTVKTHHSQSLGGYVYASASQWPIIVQPGTSVTVELSEDLTVP